MLEEEIKRLILAVLDLTAAIKEMNGYAQGNTPAVVVERAVQQAETEKVRVEEIITASNAASKGVALVSTIDELYGVTTPLTVDDARRALQALAAAKGKDAAKGVLEKFSASKIPDLAPQHWPDFIAACEGAL